MAKRYIDVTYVMLKKQKKQTSEIQYRTSHAMLYTHEVKC